MRIRSPNINISVYKALKNLDFWYYFFLQRKNLTNTSDNINSYFKIYVLIIEYYYFSVDDLTIPSCRPGMPPLRRVSEVFDCWFESGSMPYAQAHYPFEHKKEFDQNFPADFIAEGVDQTRGW